MYGPKDDRKHRDVWRELYSEAELRDVAALVRHCESNAVTFTFALSPGLDIRFSKTEDFNLLIAKFGQMISIGVTAFALFFDDLPNGGGLSADDGHHFRSVAHAQASVTNSAHAWLQRTVGKDSTLCFCPTQYCASLCEPNLDASAYLQDLAPTLSPDVLLFWTGDSIISETVSYCSVSKLVPEFVAPPCSRWTVAIVTLATAVQHIYIIFLAGVSVSTTPTAGSLTGIQVSSDMDLISAGADSGAIGGKVTMATLTGSSKVPGASASVIVGFTLAAAIPAGSVTITWPIG